MTATTRSFLTLLGLFLLSPIPALCEDVKATFPQVKPMKVSGDRIYYAVKAEVNNLSNRDEVCVTFQALDFEGFEIEHAILCGNIPPKGVRVLTDTKIMDLAEWKRINKWQRKD